MNAPISPTQFRRPEQKVVPASVTGRYRRIKWHLLVLCLAVYYAVPFLRWPRGGGLPDQAILFDAAHARIHLFSLTIRPQEFYYLTGLLVLAVAVLVLVNALAGRIWCGFFCPQTVWTDLFLLVERVIEGDRRERLRKQAAPLGPQRIAEIGLKHTIWIGIAAATGGAFVLYFQDAPTLIGDVFSGTAGATTYGVIAALTFTTYSLAGFGREKVCTFMCPWPRLQGAIWDPEALTVNYRAHRGEKRMSYKKAEAARAHGLPAGDCVDCNACVTVCPIGIDIREGPNFACINCGLCVDACDSTMTKVGRERGLIDYESWRNIEREQKALPRQPVRLIRPKTLAMSGAIAVIVGLMALAFFLKSDLSMTVIHDRNPIAVTLSDGRVRNAYQVRIESGRAAPSTLELSVAGQAPIDISVIGVPSTGDPQVNLTIDPEHPAQFRVLIVGNHDLAGPVAFTLTDPASGGHITVSDFFRLR